jgi:hypothetical protein
MVQAQHMEKLYKSNFYLPRGSCSLCAEDFVFLPCQFVIVDEKLFESRFEVAGRRVRNSRCVSGIERRLFGVIITSLEVVV